MTSFVGIDLGARHVRVVSGSRRGTIFKLERVVDAPVKISDDPEDAICEALADVAIQWGTKQRGKTRGARFGLSGKELIVRYTQVPSVPLWRLRLLMDFEVREMAAQAGDALASDYNLVTLPNAQDSEETVLVAVCKESFLARRFDAVTQALAEPRSGLPCSLALFNAFASCGEIKDGESTFLVDIGDRNVELVLQKDGELLFARNIATGGRQLTEAIAGAFGVSIEDAESIKHEYGNVTPRGMSSYASGKEEKVANALIGPVGQLSSMIQSSLAFIRAQTKMRDLEIGRILLSGGGANLRGLGDYLAAAFRCPVERFQPENGIDTSALPAEEAALFQADPGSFAVALGLARTGSDDAAFRVDIVSDGVKKKRSFAQRTIFLWLAGVIAVGWLGYSYWHLSNTATTITARALTEKNKAESDKRKRKAFDAEQARIADLNARMAMLAGMTEPSASGLRVQGLLQQFRPESIWIESVQTKRESVGDPANPKAPRVQKTFVYVMGQATPLQGQADHALTELVTGIQKAVPGCDVQIISQKGGAAHGGGALEFTLKVDLFVGGAG